MMNHVCQSKTQLHDTCSCFLKGDCMYNILSSYYDQLFKFNLKLKDFIFPYVTKKGHALELGCGTGRLAQMIHTLDMNSQGIDLDHDMIEIAKSKYPHLSFDAADILEYFVYSKKNFDLITCFGNTIVHLDYPSIHKLFRQIKLSLNKDKYFIIQLLNYTKILIEKPDSLPDLSNDNLLLKRNYIYFKDYIVFETILFKDDDIFNLGSTTLYPYTHLVLIDIGKQYGFKVECYGKPDFSSYQYDDSHVYIVFKNI